MFEEDNKYDKIYNLIITRGIDSENEYNQFTEKLYSKPEFLWTESISRDFSAFGASFFEKVDIIVILAGIYNDNKEQIDKLVEIAEKFNLPILLVRPYGLEEVPENIERKAKAIVGWNANCIIDSICGIVKGDYDDCCDL